MGAVFAAGYAVEEGDERLDAEFGVVLRRGGEVVGRFGESLLIFWVVRAGVVFGDRGGAGVVEGDSMLWR